MLTALFIVTVLSFLTFHYLFVARPRMREGLTNPALPQPIPVHEAVHGLPAGAFLQPTFTWTRIRESGEILLGLHPILVSLVGAPYKLELIPEDWRIKKGNPLIRIQRGSRELQVFSPVDGRITEVNHNACMENGWASSNPEEGCWVYRIKPVDVAQEVPSWLLGDPAANWIQTRYGQIRDFLLHEPGDEEVGFLAADGGEIPLGILNHLSDSAWTTFQDNFLRPHWEED